MTKRQQDGTDNLGDFVSKVIDLAKAVKQSPHQRVHGISEDVVIAQGTIFLLAGFETTSSTLSALLFFLAKHPDAQQKIYEEICENVTNAEEINYEKVQRFKYTEAAIHETLRLQPPLARNTRMCTSDIEINGRHRFLLDRDMSYYTNSTLGFHFKKGICVQIPTYAMHRMKEYFGEDAEEFNPDRFYSGQVDASNVLFHSFGAGPRMCLGMRFAIIEMKMLICRVLFDFEAVEKPGFELKYKNGTLFNFLQLDGVEVFLKKRQKEM